MAKALQIEGLEAGTPLEEAAAKVLLPLLGDAFARELAVRSGEAELGIHDMRVAMKRFREMFRLLQPAFPKKKHRRHLEWVEELNDALGDVRDLDVLVKHLVELAGDDKTSPAVSALLERLLTKRDVAQEELVEGLDDVHERRVRVKLERLVQRTALLREAGTLGELVHTQIRERLERVRRRWRRAHQHATGETLHSTRIANKRLRYSIEPFRALLPESVGPIYETASAFHDALGDLHDCDVMLDAARTALLATPAEDRAPLLRLIGRAEEQRRTHLEALAKLGDTLQDIEWEQLERAVAPATPSIVPDVPADVHAAPTPEPAREAEPGEDPPITSKG